jgi:multiple sugar transport system substrate-binding protein
MTWDHPRGYAPLVAAARAWQEKGGPAIEWDRRSLQDFETYPVEELARRYDLIVIDHPHVGQVAKHGCLAPIESLVPAESLAEIAAGSVGGSHESYSWEGRQLALAIDAATQVQAWVPGRVSHPVVRWRDLASLDLKREVRIPLRSPHSLMALFSLCGLHGVQLDNGGPDLFPPKAGRAVSELAALAAAVDPRCYEIDPIAVLDEMGRESSAVAIAPLIYGYVSYAESGFRAARIRFADVPVIGSAVVAGTALGGTGIAVSALGSDPKAAAEFAAWVASGPVQAGLYASHGGQPAHADAWEAEAANARSLDFYRATRATIDSAWMRPRHDGYMDFQGAASERLNAGLRKSETPATILAALNQLFRESL